MNKLYITTALYAFIIGSFENPLFASLVSAPTLQEHRGDPELAEVAKNLHKLVTLSDADIKIIIVGRNSPHIDVFLTEYARHVATKIANYTARTEVANHATIMDNLRTLHNLPTQASNASEYTEPDGTVVQIANNLYDWANSDSCPAELKDLTLKGVVGVYESLCATVSREYNDFSKSLKISNNPLAVDAVLLAVDEVLPSLLETRSPYNALLNTLILDVLVKAHDNTEDLDTSMSKLEKHIQNPELAEKMPFFRATLIRTRAKLLVNSMLIIYGIDFSPYEQMFIRLSTTTTKTIPLAKLGRFKSDLERVILAIEDLKKSSAHPDTVKRAEAISYNMAARLLPYHDKLEDSEYYRYALILANAAKIIENSQIMEARFLAMAALRAPDRDTEQKLLNEAYNKLNSFEQADNAFQVLHDITRAMVEKTLPFLSAKDKKGIAKSEQTSKIEYENMVNIYYNIRLIITSMLGRDEECLKLVQDKKAFYDAKIEAKRVKARRSKKENSAPNINKIKAEIMQAKKQQAAVQARLEARRVEDEHRAALHAAYTSQTNTYQGATPQVSVTVPQAEIKRELTAAQAKRKVRRSDIAYAAASSANAPAEEEIATAHVISQKVLNVIRRNEKTYRDIFDTHYPTNIKRTDLHRLIAELNGTIRHSNAAHFTSALRLDTFAPRAVEDTHFLVEVLRYLSSNGSQGTMTMSSNHGSRFLSRPQIEDARIILAMNGLEPIKVDRALAEAGSAY